MLRAENIEKSYGELPILKGVNLEIEQNEIVSIVGTSGAGKTTLLQILGTLDQPTSGHLIIDGEDPFSLNETKLSAFRNTTLGFIFQFHQLLPEFTACENVMLPALIKGVNKKEAEEQAISLLEKVGLQDRIKHKPSELSGGEQQRTAVCRALINKPKIIFGDEPSGNLDTQSSKELHELFFKLREEFDQTFVIVTHNKDLSKMADRSLEMVDGKFVY
ncbi:ABC transporter ATP-binding protein [Crocinitomicaceae bacterium]|nr:ABC transporter ATP-binding protein [Crocinitomicaceae bacterium]MDC0460122.1 ABC transporter ATP-binding protein [Crocinitomicaceae bacterium]